MTKNEREWLEVCVNFKGKYHGKHYTKDGKRYMDWGGHTYEWNPNNELWSMKEE